MSTTPIAAPVGRAVTVIVYEPEQVPGQGTFEIERFDLEAGETRDYEIRSATAAYRMEIRGDRFEGRIDPPREPDQEPIFGEINPYRREEMDAGAARLRELDEAQRPLDGERTAEEQAAATEPQPAPAPAPAPAKEPEPKQAPAPELTPEPTSTTSTAKKK